MAIHEKGIKGDEATRMYIDAEDTGDMSDMHIQKSKPPDGGWGWVVVFASFLIHLITDGIVYSFGIFYLEFLDFYQSGKGETAWIGSLVPGITLFVGPLAGFLAKQYGGRTTTIVGAVIAATGFVLSTFSPNLYFMYFSFGILAGVGFGLTYLPAVVIVGHYFDKKRTFAVGLASCGSGIGAFIFNPLTKILIDEYGWRGAILIQAGFILNCAVFGTVLRPLNSHKATKHERLTKRNVDIIPQRKDYVFEQRSESFASVRGKLECDEINEETILDYNNGMEANSDENKENLNLYSSDADALHTQFLKNSSGDENDVKDLKRDHRKKPCCFDVLAKSISRAFDISMFKDVIFVLFLISNVLASFGLNTPFMILYDYAVDQNVDEDSAKWLGSVIGITNTCGRVICGIIADRTKINKMILFRTALTICGLVTMLCPLCNNFTLLVIYSGVFGFLFGIYIPLMSVVLVDLLGIEMLNNSFGILLMFKGIANLIGPPVGGWLFDATGSYAMSFLVSGLTVAISGAILHLPPLIRRCHKRAKHDVNDVQS